MLAGSTAATQQVGHFSFWGFLRRGWGDARYGEGEIGDFVAD